METKIDIISGFLGAGKTTLIKKLIDEKFKEEKIAIIENEFGEVSIDGDILKEFNFNIKEIKSGCICCSLTDDFKDSIKSIIELYSPERILIEPSGVAKLSDVRHMKINNKSKVAMNIFHQARRRIALIARLLGQFADAA